MEALWQDIRYGLRALLKSRGFTLVAVLSLALGSGVNTTIFSFVNALLLRPFPHLHEMDRLVALSEQARGGFTSAASFPNFADWKDQSQGFEQMAAYADRLFTLTGRGEPEQIRGAAVSASLFSTLGVRPAVGRTFLAEDDQPGATRLVIVAHSLWQRRFGSDPSVIGQTLMLNDESYTVIGIMPAGFKFPEIAELWVPLAMSASGANRGAHSLNVIARLKPEVTIEQARAEMDTIARRLEKQYPDTNTEMGVLVVPLRQEFLGDLGHRFLLILLGAGGFVLLIACANVANLLLARNLMRHKEIAVRLALGANRTRLIRQLLTESLLVALIGGGGGLLVAFWGIKLLLSSFPMDVPFWVQVEVEPRVLAFTLSVSILTGLLFGLAPAREASRLDLTESLKEGGRQMGPATRGRRLRSLFVVFEAALALVLLIGAGLMIRSLVHLQTTDPGFNSENLLTMRVALPRARYQQASQLISFYQQLLDRIRTLPGVHSADAVTPLPLLGGNVMRGFTVAGRSNQASEGPPVAIYCIVSGGYFQTMGIPLLKGRAFADQDTAGAPRVVVISQTMARRFWPDEDPVGKRLNVDGPDSKPIQLVIVGVVGDVKHSGMDVTVMPHLYVPYLQEPVRGMTLVVRTRTEPLGLAAAVKNEMWALDRSLPGSDIRTMEQIVSIALWQPRTLSGLLSAFAALALILAVVGVYGVMSFYVAQRTHEIGIRMAMGARSSDILKLVVKQGMALVLIGVVVGLAAAFALTRVMASLLFEVSATDPATFAAIPLLLLAVALLACIVPARRATRVDPLAVLRCE